MGSATRPPCQHACSVSSWPVEAKAKLPAADGTANLCLKNRLVEDSRRFDPLSAGLGAVWAGTGGRRSGELSPSTRCRSSFWQGLLAINVPHLYCLLI